MPELPDVLLYQTALKRKVVGHALQALSVRSPFLLRTWEHEPAALVGLKIESIERLGKRLVWCFEKNLFVAIHLMIAGRFHWKNKTAMPTGKNDLAAFRFESGTIMLTEASSKKRAGLWIVSGRDAVNALHKPGLDPLHCELEDFKTALLCRNNTIKRALTDPSRFDGIGNAYSVKPKAEYWPIDRSVGYSKMTGRKRWKNWSDLGAAQRSD